jgi:hypothetical protein
MNAGPGADALIAALICGGICLAIILAIQIFFCLTLYRTQKLVAERNRELTPGLVWLDMIPIFNAIWGVIMVPKLANSLRNEFQDRGWNTEGESFARTSGMIWAWAGVLNFVIGIVEITAELADLPLVSKVLNLTGLPLGLTILISWIIYWVQMYQYGKRLRERGYRRDSIEADYDDQFQRPRRHADDFNDDDDRDRRDDRRLRDDD